MNTVEDDVREKVPWARLALGFAVSLAMALYAICAVPVLAVAVLLLLDACTLQGRLFALAVVLGAPAPVLLWLAARATKRRRGLLTAGAACLAPAAVLLGVDYALAADGQSRPGSPVRSCFAGSAEFHRASPANLVPEMDQLLLGTRVMPAMDRLLDRAGADELRSGVREVYGEMRGDPDFERLGSVLDQSYRDILFDRRDVGHFYEYVPEAPAGKRVPVVVFLHGSLGNFRGYLWVWKAVADRHGVAVVAPTFGAGRWDRPGGEEAIERVLRRCVADPRMDPSRIYLAGLSNGGLGVCRAAGRRPEAWRGLILVSPVVDERALFTDGFRAACGGKPVLILHGADDDRVPVRCIRDAAEAMRLRGMRVECDVLEGRTHFLFFSDREAVEERIGPWLERN